MSLGFWKNASPVSTRLASQLNGIVLGGIGTGGLEMWDDGRFHLWQIFNNGTFVGGRFRTPLPAVMPSSGLFFGLRTVTAEAAGLWKLQMPDYTQREWIEEPYQVPELQFPKAITLHGRQPFGLLCYELANCPLTVSMEAFTPFIIHDIDSSSWPMVQFKLILKNTSKQVVSAGTIGSLLNCIDGYSSELLARHDIVQDKNNVTLSFPAPSGVQKAGTGSMTLSVSGASEGLSYCRKWSPTDINTSLFWGQLAKDNRLQNDCSAVSRRMVIAENAAKEGWQGVDGQLEDLSEAAKESLAEQLRQFPAAVAIEQDLPARMTTGAMTAREARDVLLDTVLRRLYANGPFFGSVGRTIELQPGQEEEVLFHLCWSFPFHRTITAKRRVGERTVEECRRLACGGKEGDTARTDEERHNVGHRYETFGFNAFEIFKELSPQLKECQRVTTTFVGELYESTLPEWLCDAINAQFTTFVTNSWHSRDGRFGMWPGSGCCGFAEIGTGFFGTIPLILFFPETAQAQLEMLLAHQAEDGRVPHAFAGNFEDCTVYYDDDFPKVILQVYRDWLWTGDHAYLQRMWPRLLRLVEVCEKLDSDGDGIQDLRGHNQDYDQWMMFGLGAYTAGHWPVALRMLARMAEAMGEPERVTAWMQQCEQITRTIDETLWNGRYYQLYRDTLTGKESNALLANNLCGEWYARMLGVPRSLPQDKIRENLHAVFRLNREPGVGLRNGWLEPKDRRAVGNRDWHWNVCWLGTEYAVAAHMIYEDMVEEGLTICREGHERHHRQGLRYNHFECGEHYFRALDVWSVLLALQGFAWDAIAQKLTFVPRIAPQEHRSVVVIPHGWGRASQKLSDTGGQWQLKVREGVFTLRELELAAPIEEVRLDDKDIPFTQHGAGVRLDQETDVSAGHELLVHFAATR